MAMGLSTLRKSAMLLDMNDAVERLEVSRSETIGRVSWARVVARGTLLVVCVSAVILVGGFFAFAGTLARSAPEILDDADGIVVLTGGQDRIHEAMKLLAGGKGRRLLISGVNPKTRRTDLVRLDPEHRQLYACCVDIGYQATDTVGNADETRDWVERQDVQTLIVVTSSYHMPRSLFELRRRLPSIRLVAYPVVPKTLDLDRWWSNSDTLALLVSEYLKFVSVRVGVFVTRSAGVSTIAGSDPVVVGAVRRIS